MTWSRRMLDCAVLLGMLICASPLSAQSVQQSGVVTPTHFACWTTGGVIQDCGVAAQPFASTGGVSPGPFCVNSGPVTGPYQSFCLNANQSTGGILSIQNFGGAAAGGISFNINGSASGLPIVVLPTVSSHGACFNNTSGTLIDCGFAPSATNQIDVFLLAGQSNAVGEGSSSQSPTVPTGQVLAYSSTGAIVDANDPVPSAFNPADSANTGSAWPSFGLTYYNATGRSVLFVHVAVGGTGQVAISGDGGNNWDATGTLWAQSITSLNAAIAAARIAGYAPIFRGVIWVQGEHDATNINNSIETQTQYQNAFVAMIARYRAATIGSTTYPQMPFYFSRTGTASGLSDSGFAQVRSAQETVAAADFYTHVVFRNAVNFIALGYGANTNLVEYTQAGYNWLGRVSAANVIAAQAMNAFQLQDLTTNLYYTAGNVTIGWPVSSGAQFSVNTAGTTLPAPFSGAVAQFSQSVDITGVIPTFIMRGSNGTISAPTKSTNGSIIGFLAATGYDAVAGYGTNGSAGISLNASEDWNDASHHGTQIVLRTSLNATATPSNRWVFENDGGFYSSGVTGSSFGTGTINISSLYVLSGDTFLGRSAAATFRFGQADAASPVAQTLGMQNVVGGTSNTAGANFIVAGSRGTGTGVGGNVQIEVAPAGLTGTSQNTLIPFFTMLGNGNIGFGTETNPQFPFVFSTNATSGATVTGISAFGGPWMIGATSSVVGWNTLSVAQSGSNVFVRVDNTVGSPSNLANGDIIGSLNFSGWGNGTLQGGRARILATTSETWTTTFGTFLEFDTTAVGGSRAQSLRLMGGVIVGTGTTDPGAGQLAVTSMTQTSAAQSGTVCYSTTIGAITYDATLGCLTSLEELKNIHGPITNALAKVDALRPFWFSPIHRPAGSDMAEQPGFGAHQVEAVDRRLVGYGQDGKLRGVRYMEMSALLAAAIQELKADNENLRHEIETLKRNAR